MFLRCQYLLEAFEDSNHTVAGVESNQHQNPDRIILRIQSPRPIA